jgi:hypothetical protein
MTLLFLFSCRADFPVCLWNTLKGCGIDYINRKNWVHFGCKKLRFAEICRKKISKGIDEGIRYNIMNLFKIKWWAVLESNQ